jgi:hypothetical protein
VDKAVPDSVEKHLRSLFPAATFTRVDVLGYGDDPDVEPGETAVRAFVGRAGHPAAGWEDDEKGLQAFEKACGQVTRKLHHAGLLPSVAWVHFIPDTPARRAQRGALHGFPGMLHGMRSDVADEAEGSASVRTTLGPADLATVDALITAGIASSRAAVMRWAIGRIHENPAYAELQERVREIRPLRRQPAGHHHALNLAGALAAGASRRPCRQLASAQGASHPARVPAISGLATATMRRAARPKSSSCSAVRASITSRRASHT